MYNLNGIEFYLNDWILNSEYSKILYTVIGGVILNKIV